MRRAVALGAMLAIGVVAITLPVIGGVVYLSGRDPAPTLRVLQISVLVFEVAAAIALVVVSLGLFPDVIRRAGDPPNRLAALSLRLSERPRLVRRLYVGLVLLLIVVGALLFGASDAGA